MRSAREREILDPLGQQDPVGDLVEPARACGSKYEFHIAFDVRLDRPAVNADRILETPHSRMSRSVRT